MDRAKARRRGLILGGLAAGAAVGLAAERYLVGRDRRRPDPEARENFGELHGRDVGPLESFDGTRLHVEVVDGDGPTIVMAHGFSLDSTQWHYQIRDLAPAFRLVIYDHRGHGRSEKARRGDWSLDALARDMEAVIREHGGSGPVALLGHSMGGMTVLRFAKLFPEQIGSRVAAVVLVNTTAADVMGGMLPGAARRFAAGFQMVQEGLVRGLEVRLLDPQRHVEAAAALVAQRTHDDEPRLHQHLGRVADHEAAVEVGEDDLGDSAGGEHADRGRERRQQPEELVEQDAVGIGIGDGLGGEL